MEKQRNKGEVKKGETEDVSRGGRLENFSAEAFEKAPYLRNPPLRRTFESRAAA